MSTENFQPKATRYPVDHRHVARAGLPFATIGVFHVHPSLSHRSVEKDFQEHILLLTKEFQRDAIAGDGNQSVNSLSKYQQVYRPDNGPLYHAIKLFQQTWNDTTALPPVGRLVQSIIRHAKKGCDDDRTFPDCRVAFVFGCGKHSGNRDTTR